MNGMCLHIIYTDMQIQQHITVKKSQLEICNRERKINALFMVLLVDKISV